MQKKNFSLDARRGNALVAEHLGNDETEISVQPINRAPEQCYNMYGNGEIIMETTS